MYIQHIVLPDLLILISMVIITGAPLNANGEPIVPENDINIAPIERISPQDMAKYNAYQQVQGMYKVTYSGFFASVPDLAYVHHLKITVRSL